MAGPYRALSSVLCLAGLLGWGPAVWAHGFGQRYDLPVPLWLYVAGAAATVALSFVVVGTWMRRASHLHTYPRVNLLQFRLARLLAHAVVLTTVRLVSVGLFLLLILAGLFGTPNPTRKLPQRCSGLSGGSAWPICRRCSATSGSSSTRWRLSMSGPKRSIATGLKAVSCRATGAIHQSRSVARSGAVLGLCVG